MYSRCIRCHRSLGKNSEIAHLPIGRRIAFDTVKGRLWAICPHCDQWNLAPIEERWEALEECARVAEAAEAKSGRDGVGVARTTGGLELLRVGELSATDIANSRYGRRIAKRLRMLLLIATCLAIIVIELGIRAAMDTSSASTGLYVILAAGLLAATAFNNPPRILPRRFSIGRKRMVVWPWQLSSITIGLNEDSGRPCVYTGEDSRRRLEGREAAQFLAAVLPILNGGDCAIASVRIALGRVNEAERHMHAHIRSIERKHRTTDSLEAVVLRPWERIAESIAGIELIGLAAETRLALEMAVTEESELIALDADATDAAEAWPDQEQIASIADQLMIDENVESRLRKAKARLEHKDVP